MLKALREKLRRAANLSLSRFPVFSILMWWAGLADASALESGFEFELLATSSLWLIIGLGVLLLANSHCPGKLSATSVQRSAYVWSGGFRFSLPQCRTTDSVVRASEDHTTTHRSHAFQSSGSILHATVVPFLTFLFLDLATSRGPPCDYEENLCVTTSSPGRVLSVYVARFCCNFPIPLTAVTSSNLPFLAHCLWLTEVYSAFRKSTVRDGHIERSRGSTKAASRTQARGSLRCKAKGTVLIRDKLWADPATLFFQCYLSGNDQFDAGNSLLKQIAAGRREHLRAELPPAVNSPGQFILAVLDTDKTIAEGDETKNVIVAGPVPLNRSDMKAKL